MRYMDADGVFPNACRSCFARCSRKGCTSGKILEAVGGGFTEGNGMAFEAVISAGWRGSFEGMGSKLHRWILARVREYGSRDVSSASFFWSWVCGLGVFILRLFGVLRGWNCKVIHQNLECVHASAVEVRW